MMTVAEVRKILEARKQEQKRNDDICDLLAIILGSMNISTSSIRVSGSNEITVGVFTRANGEQLPKSFEGYNIKMHIYSEPIG